MGRKALPTDEMNLTQREHKVLDFMKKTTVEKGYPPTVREICEELNVKSTSTIHTDLSSLEKKGFIRKDPAKPRAIEIVGFDRYAQSAVKKADPSGVSSQSAADYSPSSASRSTDLRFDAKKEDLTNPGERPEGLSDDIAERTDIVDVPLVGQVAAGIPILAKENITDFFPVPSRYISTGGSHFMLTVKGESMIEAGILDGDYILVKQQNVAHNGEMVVAMVDGFESEATVKTFYKEGDHIRLQPENASMSPIIVRDVKILGIVKGVFRYFN